MPITDGKISINYGGGGGTTIEIPVPEYPYSVRVQMPITVSEPGDASVDTFDSGVAYDLRQCMCDIKCTAAEADALVALIRTTSRNAVNPAFTIQMNTGSGFYPFGPDKGDVGPFAANIRIENVDGVGSAPYLYHTVRLVITKSTATYPAYTLPTQIAEGLVEIGSVSGLRFPPEWLKPTQRIGIDTTIRWGGNWNEQSAGESSDRFRADAVVVCNQSKAAALVNELTAVVRGVSTTLTVPASAYPFGSDKADDGEFDVRLTSYTLEMLNPRYNQWEIPLSFTLEE